MNFNTGQYRVTTQPATEPLTLTEAKLHLKVDTTADDDLITALITATRQSVERYCNSALITQTVTEKYDCFTSRGFRLSVSPAIAITSVSYTDSAGDNQTLDAAIYGLDNYSRPARVFLKENQQWPQTRVEPNTVTVVYTAGYGAASDVPGPIKTAMKLMLADLYENRQDSARTMPSASQRILDPYRINYF
ncbi:MAG: phage head-tail connector protein [Saprospirales bacterium]|nr:phage head-tail connector protein [Saprospirales bacterium]